MAPFRLFAHAFAHLHDANIPNDHGYKDGCEKEALPHNDLFFESMIFETHARKLTILTKQRQSARAHGVSENRAGLLIEAIQLNMNHPIHQQPIEQLTRKIC